MLYVVIVNYNTRGLLLACLRSLREVTIPHMVIVVDNASSDGSAEAVRADFPGVTLMAQDANTWFSNGNNLGLAHAYRMAEKTVAPEHYALLLNPDTVVHPGALETLVAFMQENPDYAGCTAQLRYPDGAVQRTCSRIPTFPYLLLKHTPLGFLLPVVKQRLNDHHWYTDEGFIRETSRDVEVMPGSCTLMRVEDLWLDDKLLLYFPEDDIARQFAGRQFRFVADAVITHNEKSATQSWTASRVYFRDMLVYTRKHHGVWAAALLWALTRPVWVGMWLRSKSRY